MKMEVSFSKISNQNFRFRDFGESAAIQRERERERESRDFKIQFKNEED